MERHHSRAFWKSFSQGLGPSGRKPTLAGYLHRSVQKPPLHTCPEDSHRRAWHSHARAPKPSAHQTQHCHDMWPSSAIACTIKKVWKEEQHQGFCQARKQRSG